MQFNTACLCSTVLTKNINIPSALSSLLIILLIAKNKALRFCLYKLKKHTHLHAKKWCIFSSNIDVFFIKHLPLF